MFQEIRSQDSGSGLGAGFPNVLAGLPGVQGEVLEQQQQWERAFNDILVGQGFSRVHLPHLMPVGCFKSILSGENLLPPGPIFRDPGGMDWALRSDMTAFSAQFIRTMVPQAGFPLKIGYSGSVFSYGSSSPASPVGHGLKHPYLESCEFGAEVIDRPGADHEFETVSLALAAALRFGYEKLVLVLGHSAIWDAVSKWADGNHFDKAVLREAMCLGNLAQLALFDGFWEVVQEAKRTSGMASLAARLVAGFAENEKALCISDVLLVRPQQFYSGFVFELHAEYRDPSGARRLVRVGAGGRYDALMRHYGLDVSATGFKICDPSVIFAELRGRCDFALSAIEPAPAARIRIAVPKGRLLADILAAFRVLGIEPEQDPERSRKLIVPSICGCYEFLLVKNSDVPTYIERCVADIGIVGSDVLDESVTEVYRPVTFSFGQTRICLAGLSGVALRRTGETAMTVASKYQRMAARELGKRGYDCEIIPLSGSVELASVLGMAEAIVDLVQTGKTLSDNGLEVLEELSQTRVHLVVSRAFFYLDRGLLEEWQKRWSSQGLVQSVGKAQDFFNFAEVTHMGAKGRL